MGSLLLASPSLDFGVSRGPGGGVTSAGQVKWQQHNENSGFSDVIALINCPMLQPWVFLSTP